MFLKLSCRNLATFEVGTGTGVVATVNAAYPAWADLDGVGRNVVGRAVLSAKSQAEAVAVAAALGVASGRNYQIANASTGAVTNIEACSNATKATRVGVDAASPLFHANEYRRPRGLSLCHVLHGISELVAAAAPRLFEFGRVSAGTTSCTSARS